MSARVLAVAVALAAAVAAPRAAAADRPVQVPMTIFEHGTSLWLKTTVTPFDEAAYKRFDTGLASTVVIRIWLYPKGSTRPITFQLLRRQVVYDLWDEVYQIALDGPGARRRVHTVKFKAEALKLMTDLDTMWIAELSSIAFDTEYQIAIIAELNPVSPQTLAEVRKWLSDGAGNGLDRGGSFFGSFVSVFVNFKVPEADRVVQLRSQPYTRKRPPAP